jgi:hypothetical protein
MRIVVCAFGLKQVGAAKHEAFNTLTKLLADSSSNLSRTSCSELLQ